jgi:hypothetical protein
VAIMPLAQFASGHRAQIPRLTRGVLAGAGAGAGATT